MTLKVWLKDSISCSAINLVRPHFDCHDCARLGWRIQANPCHPAGTTFNISDFIADTKTEPPVSPFGWCFYSQSENERKRRRVVSKNETALIHWAQLCMQVTGGKSVFTRFYLSLPSFLLQVIIGTPPAPTIPGGLLLVDSQTTASANHPLSFLSLSILSFIPACVLLPSQDTFLHLQLLFVE